MKQKITIEDVAKHCHVSKSSVSRYLNQGYVSEENKVKIKKAIDELGFERDFFASRLKSKRSRLIGMVVNDLSNSEYAKTLEGMQRKLNELGYQGVILLGEGNKEKEKACLRSFIAQGVDGVIFVDCDDPEHVKELVEAHAMKVLFANHSCTFAPFLDIEEKRTGTIMGTYFAKKNIHQILYLEQDSQKGKKREEGFVSAYDTQGSECHIETLTVTGADDVYERAKELLGKAYDAVLCENELFAMALLKYFHEFHIHVPQAMSVACFGGCDLVKFCTPEITTVACDYGAFGANLVEEMISIIETRAPNWEDVSLTLLDRESVRNH